MQLHQHPDGRIFIRDPSSGYEASLADFAADNGSTGSPQAEAAFPALPPGMAERIYEPGERHVLADAKGNAFPQALPWPPGDAIIAKLAALRAARGARETPPPPQPRAPMVTVESLAAALLAKGVLTPAEFEAAKT
jgi:hypothetical protein